MAGRAGMWEVVLYAAAAGNVCVCHCLCVCQVCLHGVGRDGSPLTTAGGMWGLTHPS